MKSQHGLGALYRHIKHHIGQYPIKDTYELSPFTPSLSVLLTLTHTHTWGQCAEVHKFNFKNPLLIRFHTCGIFFFTSCVGCAVQRDMTLRSGWPLTVLHLTLSNILDDAAFCALCASYCVTVIYSCGFHRFCSVSGCWICLALFSYIVFCSQFIC